MDVLGWDAVTGAATSEGGRILSYDATRGSNGQHLVHFDGKQEEWINLTVRQGKGDRGGSVGKQGEKGACEGRCTCEGGRPVECLVSSLVCASLVCLCRRSAVVSRWRCRGCVRRGASGGRVRCTSTPTSAPRTRPTHSCTSQSHSEERHKDETDEGEGGRGARDASLPFALQPCLDTESSVGCSDVFHRCDVCLWCW